MTSALALLPAFSVPFLLSPTYEASAKIAVQGTPEVLDFGVDFMPTVQRSPRSPLGPMIAVALSDQVLGRVVDQLPEGKPGRPGLPGRVKALLRGGEGPPLTGDQVRHARIEGLRGSLDVHDEGGGLLAITARSQHAEFATFVANSVADAFVAYNTEQRSAASRSAIAWLVEKGEDLRGQIRRREEAIARLAARIGKLPRGESALRDGGGGTIESELSRARLDLLTLEQRMAALSPKVKSFQQASGSTDLRSAREEYAATRLELEKARLRYTDTHPEVRRLEAMLATLAERLGPSASELDDPLGPERMREYDSLVADRAGLQARVRALEGTLERAADSTAENSQEIAEYDRHQREVAIDRQILEVVLQRTNQTLLSSADKGSHVNVLDYAVIPVAPVSPNRMRALGVGLALAIGAGLGFAVLLDLLDRRVYDPEQVASLLGIPQFGSIPAVSDGTSAERQSTLAYGTPAGESYRKLRTSILFASGLGKLRALLITSGVAGEGKTTTSINLAASFAKAGRRVLLIDADLRRPRVNKALALALSPGLSELLRGDCKLEDAVQRPLGLEVDVITAGAIPDNPSELVGSGKLDLLLARLTEIYDLVLIDSPVLLAVSDALLLASKVEAVLLVHKPGTLPRAALARMRSDLARAGAKVLGVVFNRVELGDPYLYPSYLQSPYVSSTGWRRTWFGRKRRRASAGGE